MFSRRNGGAMTAEHVSAPREYIYFTRERSVTTLA
jgi:hypothetical protein